MAITWETTFAQLTEPERRLLDVLAWLAPEPIPLFLFEAAPLVEAIADRVRRSRALRVTRWCGLMPRGTRFWSTAWFKRSPAAAFLRPSVPRCCKSPLRSSIRSPWGSGRCSELGSLDVACPACRFGQPIGRRRRPGRSDIQLMNSLAVYRTSRNQFAESEPLYLRALAINEASFGPDHPNVASISTIWGCCSSHQPAGRGRAATPPRRADEKLALMNLSVPASFVGDFSL